METLRQTGTATSPLHSRVRLVGVGRASLNDFFFKVPSKFVDEVDDDSQDECSDNQGDDENEKRPIPIDYEGYEYDMDGRDELGMDTEYHEYYGYEEDAVLLDEDYDELDEEEEETPVVMAEFTFIRDVPILSTASESQLGNKGARSVHSSPVHALAEMSKVVNRVTYLHEDRRRLVKGLKAAKVRLEQANVFDDHDGIGKATAKDEEEHEIIEEFLTKYNHGAVPLLDTSALASMDNYGLNCFSAFSSLPQLTNVALQTFEPYYSPDVRKSEEHEMEVASFVAFRALDGFCKPQDLAWALQCTNTIERFNTAYDLMRKHTDLLENMAEYTSQDLRNCGEECTDLW